MTFELLLIPYTQQQLSSDIDAFGVTYLFVVGIKKKKNLVTNRGSYPGFNAFINVRVQHELS